MKLFSCNGLFRSLNRLGPKLKISEESPNSWIPWHCIMVSTALIFPGHYMPLPRGPTYGISCNCPEASHGIALRHYISCTNICITCCPTPPHVNCPKQGIKCHYPRSMCHCTKVLHVIVPRAKPLTGDISCNCPMAIKTILLTLGTTCHCPMA